MKKVLTYSLLLVLLAVMLNLETTGERGVPSPYADALGAVDVLAFSTGEGLPDYEYLSGQIGLDNTIMVEDLVLKAPADVQGLWVALFDRKFELMSHRRFDLGGEPTDVVAFLKHFRLRPLDSTAVLTLQGNLHSNDDAGRVIYTNSLAEVALHCGYFDPGEPRYQRILGGEGWFPPERGAQIDNAYAWVEGTRATFSLWMAEPTDGVVYVGGYGISDQGEPRHLFLTVNGQAVGSQLLNDKLGVMAIPMASRQFESGLNYCELSTERSVSPFQARGSSDDRPLGMMIDYVKFQATADSMRSPFSDPHQDNHERLSGQVDPGWTGSSPFLQKKEWYPKEKGKTGNRYAWTRGTTTHCRLMINDPGCGELVVTGYGRDDGQGERTLTLKVGERPLGTVILPSKLAEMRFPVPADIGSHPELSLVLELDRLTPAPRGDNRTLGILVDEIRFERNGRPAYQATPVPGKLWLHAQRPILLPVGNLSGSKLHLGWQVVPAQGMPPIVVSIADQTSGQEIFREQIDTSGVLEMIVDLPGDMPAQALLYVGVPGAEPAQGLQLTRLVLEFSTSEKLQDLFASLGAKSQPWLAERASWTLVTTKRGDRWVPLSESYSLTSGVMSAVTILPDRTRYDDYRGEFRHVD